MTQLTKQQLELLDEPLCTLGFEIRELNTFEKQGILTVGHLLSCCRRSQAECEAQAEEHGQCRCAAAMGDPKFKPLCHLPNISGFGDKTLKETLQRLADHGFE